MIIGCKDTKLIMIIRKNSQLVCVLYNLFANYAFCLTKDEFIEKKVLFCLHVKKNNIPLHPLIKNKREYECC